MNLIGRVAQRLASFPEQNVLGVGDLMLDQYRRGKAKRLSPEAPVADLYNPDLEERPGGAANVAWNIGKLGGKVHMVGVVGKDDEASSLRLILGEMRGIHLTAIEDIERPTTLKLRFYHEQFQVLRVSQESSSPVSEEVENKCQDVVKQHINNVGALLVEDYGKQLINESFVEFLIKLRSEYQALPVILDPKVGNHGVYRSGMCSLIKPNWKEACELTNKDPERAEWDEVARELNEKYECDVLITLGSKGAYIFERSSKRALHVPTRVREAFDVAGAGDTILSVVVLALSTGASLVEATILANIAAGISVEKSGTAFATVQEILSELQDPRTQAILQELEKVVTPVASV